VVLQDSRKKNLLISSKHNLFRFKPKNNVLLERYGVRMGSAGRGSVDANTDTFETQT